MIGNFFPVASLLLQTWELLWPHFIYYDYTGREEVRVGPANSWCIWHAIKKKDDKLIFDWFHIFNWQWHSWRQGGMCGTSGVAWLLCLRPAEGQTCPRWFVREKFSTVPAQNCTNQHCLPVSVGQIFLRDYVWNYFAVKAKMTHFVPSHVSSFPLF